MDIKTLIEDEIKRLQELRVELPDDMNDESRIWVDVQIMKFVGFLKKLKKK
jgi:hypothetical protein